ncbi:aryl-alcohol dehydrogenase [Streptomyces sp. yr375]|uniref:NAD(P)-dependent alcohol dehydrogenase n=1 Tax=Streptomyces sp. yr375 TaxID=1761906 RepID=UPI0008CA7995|nr:NAD(P)-dependent alcohol dehydrogenase [Streptomyces sp. yr375]SES46735.1 aryl-alcohol dehydrogenase [Streptomyces sp. yr375]
MRITAAVTETAHEPFAVRELELAEPGPDEVLVRIAGTGVCHTDLSARDARLPVPLPAVFGHEGAGVVERVGDGVLGVSPGDPVVLNYATCGSCRPCLRGNGAYCHEFFARNMSGRRPDGSSRLSAGGSVIHDSFFGQSAFASHAVVPARSAIVVDAWPGLPLEVLGPLGCGVQTGAGSVLNVLRCEAGSSIAVFGTGMVGCAAVLAARIAGCTTIIVVGRNPARLARAEALGATHALNLADGEATAAIRSLTGGAGADYSLEATGAPEVLRQAVDCLTPGGTCGLAGVPTPGTEVKLDMFGLLLGRRVVGIVEGEGVPQSFVPALIRLYRQGRLPFDQLITRYPLERINEAIDDMKAGRVTKPVLTLDVPAPAARNTATDREAVAGAGHG